MSPSKSEGKLRNKSAVITGGNRGIGLGLAKALAAEGCNVLISGRDQAKLKAAVRQISRIGRVVAQPCDVRDPKSVEQLFAVAKREFKSLDILINNAGIAHPLVTVDKLSLQQWNDVIATNLTGLFLCTRAVLPLLRDGGAIVNNLSIAAQTVFSGMSAYDASKHGGLGFTNTVREELRERRIRVIALIPGATDTEIWGQFMPDAERGSMMNAASIASVVVSALTAPESMVVEELRLLPIVGTSRH